jgi:hypothetical protein
MRTHGSINLIIKELNTNYTYDKMKQIEIIVHNIFLVLKQRIVRPGWD